MSPTSPALPGNKGNKKNAATTNNAHHSGEDEEDENKEVRLATTTCFHNCWSTSLHSGMTLCNQIAPHVQNMGWLHIGWSKEVCWDGGQQGQQWRDGVVVITCWSGRALPYCFPVCFVVVVNDKFYVVFHCATWCVTTWPLNYTNWPIPPLHQHDTVMCENTSSKSHCSQQSLLCMQICHPKLETKVL